MKFPCPSSACVLAVLVLSSGAVVSGALEIEILGNPTALSRSSTDYYLNVEGDKSSVPGTLTEVEDPDGGSGGAGALTTVEARGNVWAAYELPEPFLTTEETMLDVTFSLDQRVPSHSICLDDDLRLSGGDTNDPSTYRDVRCVKLAGDPNSSVRDQFKNEPMMPGTFAIPIGLMFVPGSVVYYLAIVQNANAEDQGSSTFGRIRIYDAGRPDLTITGPSGTPLTLTETQTQYGFGKDTRTNVMEVSDDGLTATLTGNTWRALPLPEPHNLTYYTRLEFELKTEENAHQTCIGLGGDDVKTSVSGSKIRVCEALYDPHRNDGYRLHYGTYDEYGDESEPEGLWVKYLVHVGQLYAGNGNTEYEKEVTHLVLMMNNHWYEMDRGNVTFRNIAIVEPHPLTITSQGTQVSSKNWVRYHFYNHNAWPTGGYHYPETDADGATVTMKGDTHIAYPLEGVETNEHTVLKVHAYIHETPANLYMCLEDDDIYKDRSGNGCFRFGGTHSPGDGVYYRGFPQLSAGEGYHYYFKLSEFKTGPVDYLAFVQSYRIGNHKDGAQSTVGNVEFVDVGTSCLLDKEFTFNEPECTVDVFLGYVAAALNSDPSCPNKDPILEMMALHPELSLRSDVEEKVRSICSKAHADEYLPFRAVTGEKQFTSELLDGGTAWNYERRADAVGSTLETRVGRFHADYASVRPISWPDSHSLRKCSLGAAMCCTVSNRLNEGDEPDPVDNSDACYMDFTDSRQSSHVRDGYAIYGDGVEGPLNCHGFAWGNDDGSEAAALRGSALFHVAMKGGLLDSGNTEELPGASMCGCIEQMPVVTEAACTKVTATTSVTVMKMIGSNKFKTAGEISDIVFADCDEEGGLKGHYEELHQAGLVTDFQKYEFDRRVVGTDGCPAAIHSFLKTKGYDYPLPLVPAPAPVNQQEIEEYPFYYYLNVAQEYGIATQSSVCHSGNARRAIDFNLEDRWEFYSITHTCHDFEPWWMVDFSANPGPVDEVVVFNRMDCCQDRINNVKVDVLNDVGEVVASQYIVYQHDKQPYNLDFGGVIGSAVKLSRPNKVEMLNFAEVQVFGNRGFSSVEPTSAPTVYYPKGIVLDAMHNAGWGESVQDLSMTGSYNNAPELVLGNRFCTYVIPPETGTYKFYIASDENAELYLSAAGTDPAGMDMIASVPGFTSAEDFFKYAEQSSEPVQLEAGVKYYMEVLYKEEGSSDDLSVAWSYSDNWIPQVIPAKSTWRPDACTPFDDSHGAYVDYWFGIGGRSVSDLKSSVRFPDNPDETKVLRQLDIPRDKYDNYGARLRAIVVAPVTGEYTLYIAGDNGAALYLSDSADPSGLSAEPIALVPDGAWTGPSEWWKFESQESQPVSLEEGQSYYLEALVKESVGGDNLAVGWIHDGIGKVTVIHGKDLLLPTPVSTEN